MCVCVCVCLCVCVCVRVSVCVPKVVPVTLLVAVVTGFYFFSPQAQKFAHHRDVRCTFFQTHGILLALILTV